MKQADTNKDGKISTDELNEALVTAVFTAADANANGSITFEEWQKVFPEVTKKKFMDTIPGDNEQFTLVESLAYCKKHKTFDKLMNRIDSNGDGIIDKAEADKFQQAMQKAKGSNETQKLKTLTN
ncbi:MAG: EF-hand domain-containing protein [Verrucomicrobiales bacterium]|nr:EF-hand domain-containing protein [Verrucomicrobiales bacterium]